MQIAAVKENNEREKRIALVPFSVEKLVRAGARVSVQSGLGLSIGMNDAEYQKAGADTSSDRNTLLSSADILLRVGKPSIEDIKHLKKGCVYISFLDPFRETELTDHLLEAGISAISMELIPRITRAQKMDALSSQASLGGYVAVLLAAERLSKIFPMMMTPAGTIAPARVFVIGAGVAGLQAIATAKRLGARVEAFDTRPVVEEQVQSLGARFIKIDIGETGQTKDGYARQLTAEQLEKQRLGMAKVCAQSDVVITTAQVFGKKAPVIISKEMLSQMKPGSVVVDMAVETGGNIEGSILNKEIDIDGVLVIGLGNLPGRVAVDASQMYSNNICNLVLEYWDKEKKTFHLNLEDEILKSALVTYQGQIINSLVKKNRLKTL